MWAAHTAGSTVLQHPYLEHNIFFACWSTPNTVSIICDTTRAVRGPILTLWFNLRKISCGIFGRQSGSSTRICLSTLVFLCCHHSKIAQIICKMDSVSARGHNFNETYSYWMTIIYIHPSVLRLSLHVTQKLCSVFKILVF